MPQRQPNSTPRGYAHMCVSELQANEVHNLISDDLSSIHVDQMEYSPRAGAVVARRFQGYYLVTLDVQETIDSRCRCGIFNNWFKPSEIP
jgi:hypothetical protein